MEALKHSTHFATRDDDSSDSIVAALDTAILILMFSQLVILDYFRLSALPRALSFVLIILRLILSNSTFRVDRVLIGYFSLLLFVASVVVNGFEKSIIVRNLQWMGPPLLYTLYLSRIMQEKPDYIRDILKKYNIHINIYFLISMAVAFLQFRYHILIPANDGSYTRINTDVYWRDVSSGLFKFCGTHTACLFTVFIILLNLWIYKTGGGRKSKTALLLVVVDVIVAFAIAALNGNKTLFIMLPIALIICALPSLFAGGQKFNKGIIVVVAAAPLALVILLSNPHAQEYIQEHFLSAFDLASDAWTGVTDDSGTTERFQIVPFALSLNSTWFLGVGLGRQLLAEANYLGFLHFGQSDLGPLLIVGGIWFTITYLALYLRSYCSMAQLDTAFKVSIKPLLLLLFMLFVLIYTRLVTTVSYTLAYSLIPILMGFIWMDNETRMHSEADE